jgi:hypothetical protein
MDKFFIGESQIIKLENITAAEATYAYGHMSIESVDVHYHGAYTRLTGNDAIKFWRIYTEYAEVHNQDE